MLGRVWRKRFLAVPNNPDDVNDRITLHEYDVSGNLLKTIRKGIGSDDPNDSNEPNDIITETQYDLLGRPVRAIDAEGNYTDYAYNSGGQLETITDSNSNTTTNYYDPNTGRLTKTENALGYYNKISFDALGRKIKEIFCDSNDVAVSQSRFKYDGMGHVTRKVLMATASSSSAIDPNIDMVTGYSYDANDGNYPGLMVSITGYDGNDPAGQATAYEYDVFGRTTKITYPDANSIEYVYNINGTVDKEIQRDGISIYYGYDSSGNRIWESDDANGNSATADFVAEFDYDDAGRLVYTAKYIDSNLIAESDFTYNSFGLKETETTNLFDQNSVTINYTHDRQGNIIEVNFGGETITYTHDRLGRIETISRDSVDIVEYQYYLQNIESIKYFEPNVTESRQYDEIGRLTNIISTDSDSNSILDLRYIYDTLNRTSVKYNHLETPVWDKYTFDAFNRITQADYGSPTAPVAYMDSGEFFYYACMLAMEWLNTDDSIVATKPQRHEAAEEKVSSAEKINLDNMPVLTLSVYTEIEKTTTEYVKDKAGQTIAKIVYDKYDRMLEFTIYLDDGSRVTIATGYDEYGLVVSNMAYTFDAYGNLTDKQDLLAQSLSLASAESMSMASGGAGGGMAMMSMGAPDGPVNNNEDFTYDLLGNRNTRNTRNNANETYYKNSLNQYMKIHTDYGLGFTSDANLAWDNRGNLQNNDFIDISYEYDYRNRLSKITQDTETIAEYTYDALGRRIRKLVDGNATYYYYDTMSRVIAEYQTIDSNDIELARTFVYGNGIDEVLAMYLPEPNWYIDANEVAWLVGICDVWLCDVNDGCWDAAYNNYNDSIINFRDYAKYLDDNPWTSNLPDGKERHYYYLHDALGSVMGLVGGQFDRDADREFYLYDVYGKPSGTESAVSGNPYGFTGRRYDSESGLYYYRARYYDSDMGRFTSIDPINYIDGMNLYEYVRSNPVNYSDPYGLMSIGGKISGIFATRLATPVITWFRANEYILNDDENEMPSALQKNMDSFYKHMIRANKQSLGTGWKQISFSPIRPDGYWVLSNTKSFGDTAYWLHQAHYVTAKGSFEAKCCSAKCWIRNRSVKWTWFDDIDANSYRQLVASGHPWWYVPLEGTWDVIGDKILDIDFRVQIRWQDNISREVQVLP